MVTDFFRGAAKGGDRTGFVSPTEVGGGYTISFDSPSPGHVEFGSPPHTKERAIFDMSLRDESVSSEARATVVSLWRALIF
jgi:hypothetical protein